jgi:putative peptidoglycan lipid II flippase
MAPQENHENSAARASTPETAASTPAPTLESDAASAKMVRSAGMLSVLTMISRVLGLIREMTKARFLGTGIYSDAFTVSFIIPNFTRRLFAEGSITVAFIPTYKGYLHAQNDEETRTFLSASLTVLTICVTAAVALGIALAPWIVKLFGSEPVETALLTRIMFPFLALVSFAALLQGILNSHEIFNPSGLAPILFNICFIVVPWLVGSRLGNPARAMAVGVVIGGLAQALVQLPAVLRLGIRFGFMNPARAFLNPGMRKVFALIAPTILGMAAYQVNDLVSTAFASRAGTGVASSLQYSLRLQELILGIFAVSAGTVLLPRLADAVREHAWRDYSSTLGRTMRSLLLLTVPVAVFSMAFPERIVTLLFKSGDFTDVSVRLTASAFFWHQTGLVFIAMNRLIAPAFYARSDAKTPTWAGIASFGVNVVLVLALAFRFQGPGIAFALSFSSAVNTGLLVWALIKGNIEGVRHELWDALKYAIRMAIFSAVAVVPALFVDRAVYAKVADAHSRLIAAGVPLVAGTVVFAAVGIALLVLTKDSVAASITNAFSRKTRGRGR